MLEFEPITKGWDALGWDDDHVLVLTERGPCLLELSTLHYRRLAVAGLDNVAGQVVRDGRGRVWLGGRGLWLLKNLHRAQPLTALLPFLADAEIIDMESDGSRIVVALRDQGLAVLHTDSLAKLGTQPPR